MSNIDIMARKISMRKSIQPKRKTKSHGSCILKKDDNIYIRRNWSGYCQKLEN